MWIPQSATMARNGSRVRCYGAPRFVRTDGRTWRPITEAMQVTPLGDGGYELRLGDEWVLLRPAVTEAATLNLATKRTLAAGHHFGPVLDAAKAPDSIGWTVVASPGVKRESDGWILGEFDGLKLGLFLRDWRRLLGEKCEVSGDAITLDLTTVKTAAIQLAERTDDNAEINLDPIITEATSETGMMGSWAEGSWAAARASLAPSAGFLRALVSNFDEEEFGLSRAMLQFDTSGLSGAVTAATLTLMPKWKNAYPHSIHIRSIQSYATLAGAPISPTVLHALATVAIADITVDVPVETEITGDALADIDVDGVTCFQVVHADDDETGPEPNVISDGVEFDDDNDDDPPTLEVTLASGGSPLTPIPSTYNCGS